MAKIIGPTPRIPTSKTEATKAPARPEPKTAAVDPKSAAKLPGTGWSQPARVATPADQTTLRTAHPRQIHTQPENDPIFGGPSRPAVVARKSLPEPHPRQGHETLPRRALTTQPRPGVSFK